MTPARCFTSSTQPVHLPDPGEREAPRIVAQAPPPHPSSAIRIANLEIRPAELQVLIEGTRVGLTVREFELLLVLSERLDTVVQRGEIHRLMWGGDMRRRDRSVDVLVRRVRNKLFDAAPDWQYIHTHFGIGYRFAPERGEPGAAGNSASTS